MIESSIIEHLTQCGLRAFAEEPSGGADLPFYIVERTGGGEDERIPRATIAVQAYGATLLAAATACEAVKTAMASLVERADVSACRCTNSYNYTDTARKKYRYQAIFSVVYYDE